MVASDCLSPTLLNVLINDSNRDMLAADSRVRKYIESTREVPEVKGLLFHPE